MKIKNVFPCLNVDCKLEETSVNGISCDSRFVQNGDVFFIIKGKNFNIFSILKDIEPKVRVFVASIEDVKHLEMIHKPLILVKDIQGELIKAVDIFYGLKKEKVNFIGVTGTNGKTTTVHLVYHCLKKSGNSAALISTIKCIVGRKILNSTHTTPGFLSLRKIINDIQEKNIRFAVMEVSSHGIAQKRIRGLKFSSCVFTNLSRDHLDYHKTMRNYFKVKSGLFLNKQTIVSVVNADDEYGQKIIKKVDKIISFGIKNNASLKACNVRMDKRGSYFDLHYKGVIYNVRTFLLGEYNIYNTLAATGALLAQGIPLKIIVKSISSFRPVEGRLKKVGKNIFVDYAHTPDALENSLRALKDIGYRKIICVFGCGGERDKGKRKIMGNVASKNADFTFITSDNPRGEDSSAICLQIKEGFMKNKYSVILDRKKAIKEGIIFLDRLNTEKVKSNDHIPAGKACLLVAGKGHENYQILKNKKIPFKDETVIKECLANT